MSSVHKRIYHFHAADVPGGQGDADEDDGEDEQVDHDGDDEEVGPPDSWAGVCFMRWASPTRSTTSFALRMRSL